MPPPDHVLFCDPFRGEFWLSEYEINQISYIAYSGEQRHPPEAVIRATNAWTHMHNYETLNGVPILTLSAEDWDQLSKDKGRIATVFHEHDLYNNTYIEKSGYDIIRAPVTSLMPHITRYYYNNSSKASAVFRSHHNQSGIAVIYDYHAGDKAGKSQAQIRKKQLSSEEVTNHNRVILQEDYDRKECALQNPNISPEEQAVIHTKMPELNTKISKKVNKLEDMDSALNAKPTDINTQSSEHLYQSVRSLQAGLEKAEDTDPKQPSDSGDGHKHRHKFKLGKKMGGLAKKFNFNRKKSSNDDLSVSDDSLHTKHAEKESKKDKKDKKGKEKSGPIRRA